MKVINIQDIEEARDRIASIVLKTQLSGSNHLGSLLGTEVHLKCENEQRTGSFKVRGAYNKIASLSKEELANGIIASSAGNHAQGVAYSATHAGVKAKIVMPEPSPFVKVDATKSYGAEVILQGQYYDESFAHALELSKRDGLTFIPPFEDPYIIAGQGTIALEILEQVKNLDSIVIPIGGGGLISGIATGIKKVNPKCKVFGVVSENAPAMKSLYQKKNPEQKVYPTIAEGIAVKTPSPYVFDNYISKYVDDIIDVTDEEIAASIVLLLERAKCVVEGAGAASVAAALKSDWKLGEKTCLMLSGGNIDLNLISDIIEKGLSTSGRLTRLSVIVDDRPGMLNLVSQTIADLKANVLEVKHDRLGPNLRIRETHLEFLLEARGNDHIKKIKQKLEDIGIRILS
jgi:threonine dehydratase